jgi:hypothetical protein
LPTAAPGITISVEDPASRDRQLEQTCARLTKEVTGCGILVTRVNPVTFEVALSPGVPYGFTNELDLL